LVRRIFSGRQSGTLHLGRDGRAEGRLLRRPGLRAGLQGNRRTLRKLFEHSGGQKFTTGGIVAAARGGRRFTFDSKSMNNSRPQLFGMLAGLFLAAGLVFSAMLGTSAWVKIKNSQFV